MPSLVEYTCFQSQHFKNRKAGKVRAVKNLLRGLLMMVFVLMAGGANAHGITNVSPIAAHDFSHSQNNRSAARQTLQQTSPDAQHTLAQSDTAAPAELHHTDSCSHSHCGHSHAAGVMAVHSTYVAAGATTGVPTLGASWASSAVIDNIERPKWPFTTPAVVSLLT